MNRTVNAFVFCTLFPQRSTVEKTKAQRKKHESHLLTTSFPVATTTLGNKAKRLPYVISTKSTYSFFCLDWNKEIFFPDSIWRRNFRIGFPKKQLRNVQFLSSTFSFRYFSIRFIQIAIKINHFCLRLLILPYFDEPHHSSWALSRCCRCTFSLFSVTL